MKPGDEWGSPTTAPPDLEIAGDDPTLAGALGDAGPDPLVRFRPRGSELARAVGLTDPDAPVRGMAVPMDRLDTDRGPGVNAVVLGTAPARLRRRHRRSPVQVLVDGRELYRGPATTVVVAVGQFIDGVDVVPRGHPGDGRLEVQVYALTPGERSGMRARLPRGTHLPHPRILTTTGRSVRIQGTVRPWPVAIDGRAGEPARHLAVDLLPGAYRLLV